MEPSDIKNAFGAHFPRCEVREFVKVSEGKRRHKVEAQLLHGICVSNLGREEGKMEIHDRFSILKEEHDHNFHSDVIYAHASLGKSIEIHEKRYASAPPAALRAAIPLHFARESTITNQSASDISDPDRPRTAAPAWNGHLPQHLEPDSVATVRLCTAPNRAPFA